ncbi:hypothetical protein DY000_02011207 [Brassica cretica]|uniref:Uncharacterized protein n=1 Tax=Brassica cretica TaxID=69181 RepID=A0ABQ7CQI5_BRACR|nr:hypothetical protein DY000_02011207 [Brassica cretica]
MLNRMIRLIPSRTAAGSSSSGSRQVRSARAAVFKMADQIRTAKHIEGAWETGSIIDPETTVTGAT